MSALELDAPRGFVSMREYLRLQRRCEALEDKIAEMESRESVALETPIYAESVNWLRQKLRIPPQGALVILALMREPTAVHVRPAKLHRVTGSGAQTTHYLAVIACRTNKAIRDMGGPERTIRGERGVYAGGYWIEEEARAWLRHTVPQAFEGDKP